MILLEDKAQQANRHLIKHAYFDENGVEVIRVPLPVGDYVLMNDKMQNVIDRKNGRKKPVGKEWITLKNGKSIERNIYEYGVELKKMDFVGCYDVVCDSKKDIAELIGDICGKDHDRFRDSLIFAQNNNIKLYIVVENKGGLIPRTKDIYNHTVRSIEDLFSWKNPRLFEMKNSNEVIGYWSSGKPRYKRVQKYSTATKGESLAKACLTMQQKYGCEFIFTTPEESAAKILELLGVKEE